LHRPEPRRPRNTQAKRPLEETRVPQAHGSTKTGRRRRVITYGEVVAGARRQFLRESTVDMDALAGELAVSRATLYRVVDGRDRLLGDVLWALAEPVWLDARAAASARGVDAILEISRRFFHGVMAAEPFRLFLAAEPETALRVLLTPAGGVHERAVAMQREVFDEAIEERGATLPYDLDDLAYLYVRIYESMLYADILSERDPNLDVAEQAGRALLTR